MAKKKKDSLLFLKIDKDEIKFHAQRTAMKRVIIKVLIILAILFLLMTIIEVGNPKIAWDLFLVFSELFFSSILDKE